MRFSIERATLLHVLTGAAKVVEARNTIPILSNVVLSVNEGQLHVRATDLDIEVSASVPLLDAQDGAVTVGAKLLTDIVKKSGTELTLEAKDGGLTVKSGRSNFKLPTLPVDDYPTLQAGTFDTEFDVDLSAITSPVAFAISSEETRYYLCGVYLHVVDGQLVAVATDGHRLARQEGKAAPEFEGVILPFKLVGMLPKGTVKFAVSANKVRITTPDMVITSKLIDGAFPQYERVIPRNNDKHMSVNRDVLLQAAERVSVVSDGKGRAIKLNAASDALSLDVRNDKAIAADSIEVSYSAEPIEIGFNGAYLADGLRAFEPGQVNVALLDSGSPALLTGANQGLSVVLMPMRT